MDKQEQYEDFKAGLKQLDRTAKSFMANGTQYFIEDSLSIDRWIKQQEIQIELGFGVQYEEMQRNWASIHALANKSQFADIVILAYNMVNGVSKVYERIPTILKYCALFINTQDEDRGIITDDMIAKKVEDWRLEGMGIDGFLAFSLSKVRGLAEDFKNATLGGLDKAE